MDTTGALRRWFQGPGGPVRSASCLLALFLVLVAVHEWTSSRPRPRLLSWSAAGPGATPLRDGARPEPVRITFSDSAAKLEDIGRPVARGIELSPRTRGTWSWASGQELVFTPDEDWPAGRTYTVRFDKAFFPGHVRLESLEGRFVTAPFAATLASSEFHVDPRDPALKRVAATFRFSHPVDTDAFEKRLTMVMSGQKQGLFDRDRVPHKFTVAYDKFHGEAYVASQPLPIPLEAALMEVAAAAGVSPVRGGPKTPA
ncbi:MAG: hypothetical protein NUW21_13220, partial [Elusimicrobia bacterium]|nr:hypothetical protein [Elusimicrobiota bacterium]